MEFQHIWIQMSELPDNRIGSLTTCKLTCLAFLGRVTKSNLHITEGWECLFFTCQGEHSNQRHCRCSGSLFSILWAVLCLADQSYLTLRDPMGCSPPGSSIPRYSPGKNTGLGCHALLQGIFPTQGLDPGLSHCRRILYHLSHQGSPWILEWVAYPFSRGSAQPRDQTGVSHIAGGFFTNWTSWEAHILPSLTQKLNFEHQSSFYHSFFLLVSLTSAYRQLSVFLRPPIHAPAYTQSEIQDTW